MGGRTAIAIGLLAGLVVGGVAVGAVLIATPGPAVPTPPPIATATATPQVSAPPSATIAPSPTVAASASPTTSAGAFGIGEKAPPLSVPQLGGGEISLSALEGKPLWINFMATWCPPCRDEIPLMNGFAVRYADTDLVVIAVDVREDEAVVDAFARELDIRFPVGLDRDGTAQSDWRALALPVHFWVDAEGIVRDGALGGIGPDIMARGLQSILPGVEVTP